MIDIRSNKIIIILDGNYFLHAWMINDGDRGQMLEIGDRDR